jgi:hypothetical protein
LIAVSVLEGVRDSSQRLGEFAHHRLGRGANQLDGVHREEQLAEGERHRPAEEYIEQAGGRKPERGRLHGRDQRRRHAGFAEQQEPGHEVEVTAAIAKPTITPSCQTPTPIALVSKSPAVIPIATPSINSIARRARWPRVAPNDTIAATGANTGLACPKTVVARSQASAAAPAVCATGNRFSRNRTSAPREDIRPRAAAASISSRLRSLLRRSTGPPSHRSAQRVSS